jgi:hypothetical protein
VSVLTAWLREIDRKKRGEEERGQEGRGKRRRERGGGKRGRREKTQV